MPQALGLLLFSLGAPVGLVNAVVGVGALGALGSAALQLGLSAGLSYLANSLFAPKPPSPQDVQSNIKAAIGPRYRLYGRARVGIQSVFGYAEQGNFHKLVYLGEGPIDAIEDLWAEDAIVTVDGSGIVNAAPYSGKLRLLTRLGNDPSTVYAPLDAAFSEITTAHRFDGMATVYATQFAVGQEAYFSTFPRGPETAYRATIRGVKLISPTGGAPAWGDNAAAVIYDYLVHPDGYRMPVSLLTTPQAVAGFVAAIAKCAEAVTLKAGGTDPRYRIAGAYSFQERPADVLARFLAACDGRLEPTPDGGLTLVIPDGAAASETITSDDVISISDLASGRDVMQSANVIRATFYDTANTYIEGDADAWIDQADVDERGEYSQSISLVTVPSHAQARRLMKLAYYRANPEFIGTFEVGPSGFAKVFGERFVNINYALSDSFVISGRFEIVGMTLNFAEGNAIRSCTIQVQSMPTAAYDWNAATEEGTAPVAVAIEETSDLAAPELTVSIVRENISGTVVPYGQMEVADPGTVSLRAEGEFRQVGATIWQAASFPSGQFIGQSGALADGSSYEFRARFVTVANTAGPWSDVETVAVVADTVAPAAVTGVSASGGVGSVTLNWTAPNSANYAYAVIRRAATNDINVSSIVRIEYGAANTADSFVNTVAAGTYYYWLLASNGSGVTAAAVATGAVTAT
jgi:hypothetical protein